LEDQNGRVATSEEEAPGLKKKRKRGSRLTILVMGRIGRVHSFQISRGFLLWTAAFFIAYILVSLHFINDYLELRRTSSLCDQKNNRLEEENAAQRRSIAKSGQQIALLETYIRQLEEGTDFSAPAKREQPRPAAEEKPPAVAAAEKVPKPPQLVDITDTVIQREGASMSINLKLINTQPGEGAVGGYIHLIAVDRKSNPQKEWPYPQEKLEKGMPVNFRKGQFFLIRQYKQMNVKFQLGSASESPSTIKVLVYDQGGELLLQKDLDVTRGS